MEKFLQDTNWYQANIAARYGIESAQTSRELLDWAKELNLEKQKSVRKLAVRRAIDLAQNSQQRKEALQWAEKWKISVDNGNSIPLVSFQGKRTWRMHPLGVAVADVAGEDFDRLGERGILFQENSRKEKLIDILYRYWQRTLPADSDWEKVAAAYGPELNLGHEAVLDVIHDLAHLPGQGMDSGAIFQGFGTHNCVAAVVQGQLLWGNPAEYADLALGLFFDGKVHLKTGCDLVRSFAFDQDDEGRIKLAGRHPLDAILQNSLMSLAFQMTNSHPKGDVSFEKAGLKGFQIEALHQAMFGPRERIISVEMEDGEYSWTSIDPVLSQRFGISAERAPVPLSIKNEDDGYHIMLITGIGNESGRTGYWLADPEGYRQFFTRKELTEQAHQMVLSQETLQSVADAMDRNSSGTLEKVGRTGRQ